VDYIAQTLIGIDETGALVPLLATEWTTADDGLAMDLTLRVSVTFHNGTPLTADVEVWNFDLLLDPEVNVPRRGPYGPIESAEAVDDLHVRLHLTSPAPYMAGALTQSTAAIISPASVDMEGNSYANITHPVGTGPYRFESRSFGENIQVSRFDDYWGEPPFYDRV